MNGDIEKALAEKAKEHLRKMDAVAQANAVPLPGALRDAFATAPEIEVGPYKIRPFYDADFEFLQELNHPLHEMIVASQAGKTMDTTNRKRSTFWELFYLFTHPIDEIDSLFARGKEGIAELRSCARKEFSRLQGPAVMALDAAIGKQLERYFDPCIGYEAAPTEGEEATSKTNFTQATVG